MVLTPSHSDHVFNSCARAYRRSIHPDRTRRRIIRPGPERKDLQREVTGDVA
jgi:hypothetical protein